jgi:hypothetical protein
MPSLVELCVSFCQSRVTAFKDLNGVPSIEVAIEILRNASPQKLAQIEDNTPFLQGKLESLWNAICVRVHNSHTSQGSWRETFFVSSSWLFAKINRDLNRN